MIKKTYSEKLQDPRWQKKRLEILERDKWECQHCGDKEETLHVHHKSYGNNTWDVDNTQLITLCKHCHEVEENFIKDFKENSLSWVNKSEFSVENIVHLLEDLDKTNYLHPTWELISAIKFFLTDRNAQLLLVSAHKIKRQSYDIGYEKCMADNNIEETEFPF